MVTKAKIAGRVTRIVPPGMEFTLDARLTDIGGRQFIIGQWVTFKVEGYCPAADVLVALAGLSAGDVATIWLEKDKTGVWNIVNVVNSPQEERTIENLLGELEKNITDY